MKLYRPVTLLVGILFVVLAGVVRLGLPNQVSDEPHRKVFRAAIGEPIVRDGFTFNVVRVRAAQAVVENPGSSTEEPMRTNGIFVAVEYEVSSRKKAGSVGDPSLRSGSGVTYEPAKGGSMRIPQPGFTLSDAVVFEVNPDEMADLKLRVKPGTLFTVTTEDYFVDLGIPGDAVPDLVERAAKEYAMPGRSLRVTS